MPASSFDELGSLLKDNTFGGRLEHRGGVSWYEAVPHRWFQRHQWQTRGFSDIAGTVIERCSCGASRRGSESWLPEQRRTRRTRRRMRKVA